MFVHCQHRLTQGVQPTIITNDSQELKHCSFSFTRRAPGAAAAESFHATTLHFARLNLLIVLGLALSGQVAIAPLPVETSEARVVVPAGVAKSDDAPALVNKRANRQRQREHDRKRAGHAQEQGRECNRREFCTVPASTRLPRVDLGIHGADPALAGLDVDQAGRAPFSGNGDAGDGVVDLRGRWPEWLPREAWQLPGQLLEPDQQPFSDRCHPTSPTPRLHPFRFRRAKTRRARRASRTTGRAISTRRSTSRNHSGAIVIPGVT
jgi:hypothetical protein